jgi:hypothetical protein
MTAAAGATPPSTTNVGGAQAKPATGTAAPAETKVAPKMTTGSKAGQVTESKVGAPTSSNRAPVMPKGYSSGGEGVRGTPPNDNCSSAIALNIGDVYFGDTIGATAESPVPPFCGTSLSVGGVWFTFVGDGSTLPVTTCGAGTTYDSKIYVYTGDCGSLTCVAGNDDTCGLQAQVTVATTLGTTYRVLVAGFGGAQGNFQLTIGTPPPPSCADCPKGASQEGEGQPCGIPSDFFNGGCNSVPEAYSAIACGQTVCGSGAFDGSFRDTDWYQINVTEPTEFTWSCDGSNFDWQLFIIDLNAGCGGLTILSAASGTACSTGSTSAIVGPGTYAMFMGPQFAGNVACETDYTVSLACAKAQLPDNDDCATAQAVTVPSSTLGSNQGALPDPNAQTCVTGGGGPGVWYSITGDGTTVTATTCSPNTPMDTKLLVYCGPDCDNLFCVTGNDDDGVCSAPGFDPPFWRSTASFCTVPGQTYWIFVMGFGGSQGDFELILSSDGFACSGAARCEPIVIECAKGDVSEGEFESGSGCGVPVDFFNGGCNSVPEVYSNIECGQTVCGSGEFDGFTRDTDWYLLNLTGPTEITWTMQDSAFDWVIFIIDLTPGCGGLGIVSFATGLAGVSGSATGIVGGTGTYALFVGPNFTQTVACPSGYRATVTCAEAVLPKNDECSGAIALEVPSSTLGSNQGSLPDPGAFTCVTGGGGPGVWYSIVGDGTTITATTCSPNTPMDTKLLVYCGPDCDNLFCVTGNDDDGVCSEPGFSPPFWRSTASFCTTAGQTYWIFVMGFGGSQGDFELILSSDGFACDGAAACEPIVVTCAKGDIAEGEFEGGFGCGVPTDFFNGGCNSVPEVYSNIACGDIVCGSGEFNGFTRDTDWYQITVTESTEFTWSVLESSFEWVIFIIDLNGGCGGLGIVAFGTGLAGQPGSISGAVGPGTYAMFMGPNFTVPVSCPSGYRNQLTCGQPCAVKCSGTPEGEDDCGVPTDTFNGGCNSVPPVFSSINCGDVVCGTGAFDGFTRDTDWYSFTNDTGGDVTLTFTVASEFAFLFGYIEWLPGLEGSGDCANISGFVNPFGFPAGDCQPYSVTVTVGAGEHWFFVAPQFAGLIGCGAGNRNNYVATLTGDNCGGGGADCNENGIDDAQDIANGTSDDCFDYAAAAGTRGGANGIPDECECVADWNRDGIANSTDVSDFINTFFADQTSGNVDGDVNCDGVSNSTDVSDFINIWFAAQAGQLPFAGCTI